MHTDSETKIINTDLSQPLLGEEGRQSAPVARGTDIEDYVKEISPIEGALLVSSAPTARGTLGHLPFEGPRRSIQFNWVTDRFTAFKEKRGHFLG